MSASARLDKYLEIKRIKKIHDADLLEKTGKIGILQGVRSYLEFGLGGLTDHRDYKSLYAIVKRRADLDNVSFYTAAGSKIAARRGGIQFRREFFMRRLSRTGRIRVVKDSCHV